MNSKDKFTNIEVCLGSELTLLIKISNTILYKINKLFYDYQITSCDDVDLTIQKNNSKILLKNKEKILIDSFSINENTFYFRLLTHIEDVIIEKTSCLAFHGSAFKKGNNAILFCGKSRSGKTTIALEQTLSDPKYNLVSDDILFIKNNHVKGLQLPIKLRSDIYLKHSLIGETIKTKSELGEERILFLPDKKPNIDLSIIKAIVFPRYNDKSFNQLSSIKGSKKVNKLIENVRKSITMPILFKSISSLCENVPMYELDFCSSNFAKSSIKKIV